MAIYTVHCRESDPQASLKALDSLKLVKDGFNVRAFVLPLPWLLLKGMWIVFAFILALQIAVMLFARDMGFPQPVALACSLIVHIVMGYEAAALHRWTLTLRGYGELGHSAGDSDDEAALRFLMEQSRRPWG